MPDADVMMVMQHPSMLPEDRWINTLHFSESALVSWENFAAMLAAELPTAWNKLGTYFPDAMVNRVYSMRIYNPEDQQPRPPYTVNGQLPTATFVSATSDDPLPTEVALCLSYFGASNTPRHRGRIYIGPLGEVRNLASRPSQVLIDALQLLGRDLSDVGAVTVDWQIVSPTGNTRERIQETWVDNAWDTQRRRGLAPTARTRQVVSG